MSQIIVIELLRQIAVNFEIDICLRLVLRVVGFACQMDDGIYGRQRVFGEVIPCEYVFHTWHGIVLTSQTI